MRSGKKTQKRSSVGKKLLYILTSLFGVVVILLSCVYGAFYHYYSKMNIVTTDDENAQYVSNAEIRPGDDIDTDHLSEEDLKQLAEIDQTYKAGDINFDFSDSNITNIMIVGTDYRGMGRFRSNSDAMVLISINKNTKKLFITSFMRDILLDVPQGGNHKQAGKAKLNSAFGYGGSSLMFQTYKDNFGIEIDKYVHMDFYNFMNIIDYLGGIDMYVSAEEAGAMNYPHIREMNNLLKLSPYDGFLRKQSGTFHLNGKQTLAYTRVRYVGGGDFGRTERQRKVIAEIIKKIKKMSAKKLNSFVERCLRYVTTNVSQTELMSLLLDAKDIMNYEQVNARIPIDSTYKSSKIQGTYVLLIDLKRNAEYWYSLVYLDKDISGEIIKEVEQEKAEAAAIKAVQGDAQLAVEEAINVAKGFKNAVKKATDPSYIAESSDEETVVSTDEEQVISSDSSSDDT